MKEYLKTTLKTPAAGDNISSNDIVSVDKGAQVVQHQMLHLEGF